MRIRHSCGLIFLLAATFAFQSKAQPADATPKHLLLRGNIVTSDGVIPHGWLEIYRGRIVHIEHEKPDIPGAKILETDDLIFPGFIDLHNHPSFNIFPR
jgi:cytosine/adenosine deaminase-related metal-dependent hydrolase